LTPKIKFTVFCLQFSVKIQKIKHKKKFSENLPHPHLYPPPSRERRCKEIILPSRGRK
jgi:hypothetical protein